MSPDLLFFLAILFLITRKINYPPGNIFYKKVVYYGSGSMIINYIIFTSIDKLVVFFANDKALAHILAISIFYVGSFVILITLYIINYNEKERQNNKMWKDIAKKTNE